nr:hypothetical protein [uncultured Hyphomonas sp.]
MPSKKTNRDDFTERTKIQIAKRAGWLCSFPECRKPTVGGEVNIGTAAHICAAAPGGPRYDPNMTRQERRSEQNGIWMCRNHGAAIDSNDPQFTVEILRRWKSQAELQSLQDVLHHISPPAPTAGPVAATLAARLRAAAEADLKVFRRMAKWPATSVPLRLKVEGVAESITTAALAEAVIHRGDLMLIAPPGAGKTTTLFQIAESVLTGHSGTPVVVLLGDWQTQPQTILESILARPAFNGISEQEFRAAADGNGFVMLLDGWNELDIEGRKRAHIQIEELKAQLPELALMISTRRQALDVPLSGTQVHLLPLTDVQQMEIASAMWGDPGRKMVDQAWRTPGVRELVSNPLYLTALLTLTDNAPFPTTKEEVLRCFVAAHQKDPRHAERLRAVMWDFSENYLDRLATFATQTANTAITDTNARAQINATSAMLVDNGQIMVRPEPSDVLDVLVSDHLLMRAGDAQAVSFQHQQIQEWFASRSVEERMLAELDDPEAREWFKSEVFNLPAWEEAIMFAVERLSRGDAHQRAICAKAIVAAFEVDPILAADMIFRATDDVWKSVAPTIEGYVARWHAPGTVDGAFRFMLTTGRPEFLDKVWPLLVDENDQVSLKAIRHCRSFRPSILGSDAVRRIKALPSKPRLVLLHEIASNSGIEGLDLATSLARSDPDPEVQAAVLDALSFRRADRHVEEVLRGASAKTFDLVVSKGFIESAEDPQVQQDLQDARERQEAEGSTEYARLRAMIYAQSPADRSNDVEALVASMPMERDEYQSVGGLLFEAGKLYPRAVAQGLLQRVRKGSEIYFRADDILAMSGIVVEDDALLAIALEPGGHSNSHAEAAASVLGPISVGKLIDAYLEVHDCLRPGGKYDKAAGTWHGVLRMRIGHTPGSSLVSAIQARAKDASPEHVAEMANILKRRDDEIDRGRPFDNAAHAAMNDLIRDWTDRLLSMGDLAKRHHLASVAWLAAKCPSVELLPVLKRLLDEELRRIKHFRERVRASEQRDERALQESRMLYDTAYKDAFTVIVAPETTAMMREYLPEELFGEVAAIVMKVQWIKENEPKPEKGTPFGPPEFAGIEDKRAAYAENHASTCDEAEAMFETIDLLTADGATEDQRKHALALAIQAARLPHGDRPEMIFDLLAATPQRARTTFVFNLIMSGKTVSFDIVKKGIEDLFEEAKKRPWILSEGHQLKAWLKLLPFTDRPALMLDIIRGLTGHQRDPEFLEEMVKATEFTAAPEAEEALFALAEDNPKFYGNYAWRNAVLHRKTLSAAKRYLDLVLNGTIQNDGHGGWHMAEVLGDLLNAHAELRTEAYATLKAGDHPRLKVLIRAVAETVDPEGLLLLIELENKLEQKFVSWRTIQRAITDHVPSEQWKGAFDVIPVSATELRAKLLAMTTDGGKTDAAARTLRTIQNFRDDYGAPEDEPRHPDLASGNPWPILTPDPEASAR